MQINEEKRTLHPEKRVYIQTFVTCVYSVYGADLLVGAVFSLFPLEVSWHLYHCWCSFKRRGFVIS